MRRISMAGLGAVALLTATSFVSVMPAGGAFFGNDAAVAQNNPLKKQAIQLRLTAEKQVKQTDKQGKMQTVWQPLQGNAIVPGDLLRYTVSGENTSDKAVKNLVITQPIPKQTVYVLDSTSVSRNTVAKLVYSIDNGKSFVEKPQIQVKQANGKLVTQPAPAAAYTHIRWTFPQPIGPSTVVNGTYQVKVR